MKTILGAAMCAAWGVFTAYAIPDIVMSFIACVVGSAAIGIACAFWVAR